MTRLDKLIRAGIEPDTAAELASVSAAQVDLICKAARQAARAAIAQHKERRARDRKHRSGRTDASQVADGAHRLLSALASRAAEGDLTAAGELYRLYGATTSGKNMQVAVDGLRARGYSDEEIAREFGTSRPAVNQRFGHRIRGGPSAARFVVKEP